MNIILKSNLSLVLIQLTDAALTDSTTQQKCSGVQTDCLLRLQCACLTVVYVCSCCDPADWPGLSLVQYILSNIHFNSF